jgi:hypothetical protein
MNPIVITFSILMFLASLGLIIYTVIRDSKNANVVQGGNVYSFAVPYVSPGSSSVYPPSAASFMPGSSSSKYGQVTLSCPTSTHINLISASYSINDVYGQCVSSTLCAAENGGVCNLPAKSLQRFCTANPTSAFCSSSVIGTDPSKTDYAALACSSFGTLHPGALSGMGTAGCVASRDATAWVGREVNGLQQASFNMSSTSVTGPLPCLYADVTTSSLAANYVELPDAPHMLSSSNPSTPSLGYTMHGVYACVPNNSSALF